MATVEIRSFGRLHFGLMQISAAYPRRNMGIGAALTTPYWHLRVRGTDQRDEVVVRAPSNVVPSETIKATRKAVRSFYACGGPPIGLQVEVIKSIPAHIGLGSKTAFLRAIRAAYGLLGMGDHSAFPIEATGRGGTSGIGVNLTDAGGVVVDTGHFWSVNEVMDSSRARAGAPAPGVLVRYRVENGMFLLARMRGEKGPSGEAESRIFRQVLPFRQEEADRIAGRVLFEALPALSSGDWRGFGHALAGLQHLGFKSKEWLAQSQATKALAQLAYQVGADCVALSSMGPTVAIIAADLVAIRRSLKRTLGSDVVLLRAQVNNSGMEWSLDE